MEATRKTPVPDRVVELKPKSCPRPRCSSRRIRVLERHERISEDIRIVKITTFIYYECMCEDCGARFVTRCEELPKEGNFGPKLLSLWTAMHYVGTIPFARLSAISENCLDVSVSPRGLQDAIYRTAATFRPYFRRIRNR